MVQQRKKKIVLVITFTFIISGSFILLQTPTSCINLKSDKTVRHEQAEYGKRFTNTLILISHALQQ